MKKKIISAVDFAANKTNVGEYEFANNIDLVRAELPSTITEIGEGAFKNCTSLEYIAIPESVKAIGSAALCGCSSLKNVVIPEGVTVLEDLVFALCDNLEVVKLPETLLTIRPQAFRGCVALRSVNLPENVESIGAHAFDGCEALVECNRPAALKQVGGYAFFNTPLVKGTRYIPEQTLMLESENLPYVPSPVDTADVALTEDILELSELLAKNTHEVWSETRMRDGWTYGSTRDDAAKKHPCLVPYEALSEGEKEYDRNTSIQTLKLIQKLGFVIQKKVTL